MSQGSILTYLILCCVLIFAGNTEMQEQRVKPTNASVIDLKPPPLEKIAAERLQGNNGSMKQVNSPITATSYSVAALQTATNSFSQESLIGEGSIGRVYKGEFPNGKVLSSVSMNIRFPICNMRLTFF